MCELDVICDLSGKDLDAVPDAVMNMPHLKMLYLDRNRITALPEDLFQKLPHLQWLDLRDNRLVDLPKGIAKHKCLENLLLQNNRIERLPDEIGFLPKLKALQISNNPLGYPPQEVVDRGIDDITVYLQQEYHKRTGDIAKCEGGELPQCAHPVKSVSSASSSILLHDSEKRTESGTLKLEVLPTVLERNLAERIQAQRQSHLDNRCDRDKVHKVLKSASKTAVHSYYKYMNVRDYVPSQDKINAEQVKQLWLEKLRELIKDQERILQRERTLTALKSWRKAGVKPSLASVEKQPAPFDTNDAFNAYMSREDVTADVSKALVEQQPKYCKPEVDSVMQEVMAQLNKARQTMLDSADPQERIANAQKELEMIVNLHKKIANIQKTNFI